MNDIESIVKQKLDDARVKFFIKDTGLSFFSSLQYKYDYFTSDMGEHVEGYVTISEVLSEYKDRQISIGLNQHYVGRNDYSFNNLIFLILHEIMHVLHRHATRRGTRDWKIWNIATDHIIDRDLKEMDFEKSGVVPYENRYNIIKKLHNEQPTCSVEYAYDWIANQVQKNNIKITQNDDGSITSKHSDNKTIIHCPTIGGLEENKNNIQELGQHENTMIAEATARKNIMESSPSSKGDMSGILKEYLDKLLHVKVPWDEILLKAIRNSIILKPSQRSWHMPNKFYYHTGLHMPGVSYGEEKDEIGTLIIAIDTSGSISKKDLKQFSYVIYEAFKYFSKIITIQHDVNVHKIKQFNSDESNEFLKFIKETGFKGRGGTSHEPIFNNIEKHYWNKPDKRDLLSMVICLSDCYSDIITIYKKYDWIKSDIPLIFVTTENGNKLKINENEKKDYLITQLFINENE